VRHATMLLALAAAGCSSASTQDTGTDRRAIAAATAATQAAENAGSVEQMRVHMAPDVVMMAPGMPAVSGRDSASAAMQGFFATFAVQIAYQSQEIVVAGDWGFDRGTYRHTLTPKAGGAAINESGKYLWIYQRHADGWKQSRVIWNSDSVPGAGGP